MFKEKDNESNSDVLKCLQEVHYKLKILENIRAESFVDWKFSEEDNCSVSEMAKAGFYFSGNMTKDDDSATCFLCGKVLDGWENTDDPWIEHTKHSANCKFVQMRRCEDDITVEEMLDLCKLVIKQFLTKRHEKKEAHYTKEVDKTRSNIQNP